MHQGKAKYKLNRFNRVKRKLPNGQKRVLKNLFTADQNGLQIVNFPPNSGDLNPIETVWARLCRDQAAREMQDLRDGVILTEPQYRQRAAQLLAAYGQTPSGGGASYLEKLVAGMPKRLQKCKANGYGRCGK